MLKNFYSITEIVILIAKYVSNPKHPECKKRSFKKGWMKRIEIKMGGQGRCSDSADEKF